jgi:two-component system, OmpR family, response regulator ChvI
MPPVGRSSTSNSADSINLPLTSLGGEMKVKEEVQFLRSQNYCVCFIQMVNPTGAIITTNDSDNIRKYYTIFINTMSAIARNFGAKIVKNITDSLIIYFPLTSNSTDDSAFKDVIECGITMLAAGDVINTKLTEQKLSIVTYRISADYGKVEVARSTTSQHEDLFGPTMNLCAKINSKTPPNGMVIGGDLYTVLKSFSSSSSSSSSYRHNEYRLKEVKGHSISGLTHQYPVYSVTSKYSRIYPDVAKLSTLKDGKQSRKPEIKKQALQIQRPSFSASPISTTSFSYSGFTIMLVDDEQDVLYSFHAALTNNGYDVEAFSDSHEALRRFSEVSRSHFGLVILDVRMPGLNGLELYTRLKSINRSVKILFVSALDVVPELVIMFPDVKQDDILRKPVSTEEFINSVKTALA